MESIIVHEQKIRDLDELVSKFHLILKDIEETDTDCNNVCKLVTKNAGLLSYFSGLDADIASKIDSYSYWNGIYQLSLESFFNKLSDLKCQIDNLESLLTKVSTHSLAGNEYDKKSICNEANDLIHICKNELKFEDIDDMLSKIGFSMRRLDELFRYLNSDKAKLDGEISKVNKQLNIMSQYADRYDCNVTINKTRRILQNIPSGDTKKDLSLLKQQMRTLETIDDKFKSERVEAISIYKDACSKKSSIWTDELDYFQKTMAFVPAGKTSNQNFDLNAFKDFVNQLCTNKYNDIKSFTEDYPSLAERYADSLQQEIVDNACSSQDFLTWQESVMELDKERVREKWKRVFKIIACIIFSPIILVWIIIKFIYNNWDYIWPVLKVLLWIVGIVFVIGWFIFKTMLTIATRSSDDS